MTVIHRLSRNLNYRLLTAIMGLLLLIAPLIASCGTPAPLQFINLDMHLPAQALNAPVVGPLPDNTPMRVGITFKVSQSILNHFDSQKIQPGHPSNLEQAANQIG